MNTTNTMVVTEQSDKQNIDAQTDFYAFYLQEHQNVNCRKMHFLGTSFGVLGIVKALQTGSLSPIAKGIVAGYACAWVGHYVFEKNKPATFQYPLQSFIGDWRMYADIWRGRISLFDNQRDKTAGKKQK